MSFCDDETKIPFGKFKDEKMANVPAWYLIYVYDNRAEKFRYVWERYTPVFDYIEQNMDVLKVQKKRDDEAKKYNNRYNTR